MKRLSCGLLLGSWCVVAPALAAQRQVALDSPTATASIRTAGPLARTVTVQFDRTPLAQGVAMLSAQTGVKIYYQVEHLKAVPHTVSLQVTKLPLGDALSQLFAGTGLQPVAISDDVVAIRAANGHIAMQGTILGKVLHAKTRQPIPGARVTVDGSDIAVTTGADGTFRLERPAGTYTVRVRSVGYVRHAQQVALQDEATQTVEFYLEPSASMLDEVVVTGTVVATERKAIATPITVITAAEIEKRGITRIEEFLRGEVPGVFAADLGSVRYAGGSSDAYAQGSMETTEVYSRGASNFNGSVTPLKTYIDGVETLDPSALGTIDPASIERIEIITGPQAATVYGSGALGGVMQIFTKRGIGHVAPQITAALMMGTIQNSQSRGLAPSHSHRLTLTGGAGPVVTYTAGLSYTYTGQWQPRLFARRFGAHLGLSYVRDAVTVTGAISISQGRNGTTDGSYAASSQFIRQRVASGDWSTLGSAFDGQASRVATSSSQTSTLNADYRVGRYWQHHLTIGRDQTRFATIPFAPRLRTPSDSLYGASNSTGERNTFSYNTTVVPRRAGWVSATVTTGVSGSQGLQLRTRGCLVTKTAASYISCYANGGAGGLNISNAIDSKDLGGFVTGRVGFWEQLYLTLGLRGEKGKTYGRQHAIDWTPTTGMAYTFDAGPVTIKLLGSYGKATRPPAARATEELRSDFSDFWIPEVIITQFANPALRPERSSGPQGGMEIYFGNVGFITLNRYDQRVQDLVQQVLVDSIWRDWKSSPGQPPSRFDPQGMNVNTSTIRQHGWETTFSLNIMAFTVKGTYSLSDSRIVSLSEDGRRLVANVGYFVGQSFLGIPSHTGNLAVGYSRGGSSVTVVSNWIGASSERRGYYSAWRFENQYGRQRAYVGKSGSIDFSVQRPVQGYAKSDLNASHRINSWVSANINIKNIANGYDNDIDRYVFAAIGRQTQMGLTLRLPK